MAPNLTTYSSKSKFQIIERLKPSDILSSPSSCFKNVGGNFFFTYNSNFFFLQTSACRKRCTKRGIGLWCGLSEFTERTSAPFRWRDGVRRACAEREIGLEAAREVCLDRDAWRSLTDRIV